MLSFTGHTALSVILSHIYTDRLAADATGTCPSDFFLTRNLAFSLVYAALHPVECYSLQLSSHDILQHYKPAEPRAASAAMSFWVTCFCPFFRKLHGWNADLHGCSQLPWATSQRKSESAEEQGQSQRRNFWLASSYIPVFYPAMPA